MKSSVRCRKVYSKWLIEHKGNQMSKCKCCDDKHKNAPNSFDGFGFNRLEGDVRQWATDNKVPRSEFTVRVKGGRRFGGPDWIKKKCGDGRMGFTTRRKNQSEAKMETGLDGQYKKSRHTIVRRKSAMATAPRRPRRVDGSKFRLVSSTAIQLSSNNPDVIAQRRKENKKLKRARNRNNAARRGHKRAVRIGA